MADFCHTCRGTGRTMGYRGYETCDTCGGTGAACVVWVNDRRAIDITTLPTRRLVVSDCKTGAFLRCTTEGEGERIAKVKGWKDYEIRPDEVRHV